LIADGVHSLSDLVTDALVIWAAKYGSQAADEAHPYGHERIQTLSTVLLGSGLIVVALGIGQSAIARLVSSQVLPTPDSFTLIVAAISIVSKEWIYRYTVRVARQIKSKLVEANAWHSRSDAFSSIVVLVGIVGTMWGFEYLDSIAAIVVASMIVHVGGKLIVDGIKELIDTGVESDEMQALERTMAEVEGVRGVHQLRTRKMGSTVVADVHILVDPDISVSEGHRISVEVESAIDKMSRDPMDVTVHIDPEDDSDGSMPYLPMRLEIDRIVRQAWAESSNIPLENIGIHYLGNKIDIDLELSVSKIKNPQQVAMCVQALRQALSQHDYIGQVKGLVNMG
jgi:cation diffusion facilitator family transporter